MEGNDFLLKLQGVTHIRWLQEVLKHPQLLHVNYISDTGEINNVDVRAEDYQHFEGSLLPKESGFKQADMKFARSQLKNLDANSPTLPGNG